MPRKVNEPDERTVRSIMVPWANATWLDMEDDLQAVRDKIEATDFSRFPVCRGIVAAPIGVIRTRDILDVLMRGGTLDLAHCMAEPMMVLDSTPINNLFDEFKRAHRHMAIVVNQDGGLCGLVTMTDLFKVVAGVPPADRAGVSAVQDDDGVWQIDGIMAVEDFENLFGLSGISGSLAHQTIAGFVLHRVERFPYVGECLYWNDFCFEVIRMDGYGIDQLRVTPPGGAAVGNAGHDGAAARPAADE